jgi:hypothetical protein
MTATGDYVKPDYAEPTTQVLLSLPLHVLFYVVYRVVGLGLLNR